jgi:hypothetical protein
MPCEQLIRIDTGRCLAPGLRFVYGGIAAACYCELVLACQLPGGTET